MEKFTIKLNKISEKNVTVRNRLECLDKEELSFIARNIFLLDSNDIDSILDRRVYSSEKGVEMKFFEDEEFFNAFCNFMKISMNKEEFKWFYSGEDTEYIPFVAGELEKIKEDMKNLSIIDFDRIPEDNDNFEN